MEVPEKIYLSPDIEKDYKELERDWYTIRISHDAVEYTRTDAFIEKMARFLEYKLGDRVEIRVAGTIIPSLTGKKAFIEEVSNFMKGE